MLLYAVPKLHRMQAPADGWAGAWGSRLVLVGAGVMVALGVVYLVWEAVGDPGEPAWTEVVWLVGFAAFVLGIVLFAIGSAISARFTRAAPIVMLVALVVAVAIDMATGAFFEEDLATREWGFLIGVPVFGLALAWMGAAARSDNRPPTAAVRR